MEQHDALSAQRVFQFSAVAGYSVSGESFSQPGEPNPTRMFRGSGDSSPNVPLNQAVFFDIRLMQLNMEIVRLSNLTEHEIAPKSNSLLLLR